jgi:trans-L-3-hydroxyproline dehydratase
MTPDPITFSVVHLIRTIDAHVGGQPLRLITDGVPRPLGKDLPARRNWFSRHADGFRRSLLREPRGHADMTAALLTDPVAPGADAGILFMDAVGYPSMSGHGIIAAATIAIERRLFFSRDLDAGEARLVLETPAGAVAARARVERRGEHHRVDAVAFTNVPAFVYAAGHVVKLGSRDLRVDLAFGGAFFAIVDTEAIGIPLTAARLPDLRRLGAEICRSIDAAGIVQHPAEPSIAGVSGVIFTGPSNDPEAHLRNVMITGSGAADRSPGGTGTSAVMAVLDAMGLLPEDQPFVHEGFTGSLFRGRAVRRTLVGDYPALVTEIEGSGWITGQHTFEMDDEDPLREGIEF